MSKEKFDDDCDGCRPALIDLKTGQRMGPESPIMQAVNRVWETNTTLEERQAFHRVCCLNSREQADLIAVSKINERIKAAAEAAGN